MKDIDYASLNVVRGYPVGNAMRSGEFQHRLDLSRMGKPVDRTLWGMTPQTVNAYYDPLNNQITSRRRCCSRPISIRRRIRW